MNGVENSNSREIREGEPNQATALAAGLGGEGCAVIEKLIGMGVPEWLETAVLDTDSNSIENSRATHKLGASSDWTLKTGAGCGGDIIRGERSIARERAAITKMMRGKSLVIVTGGLGGGTCTGGIRTLASVARAEGVPTVFILTTPFSFESYSRRRNSEECIRELIPACEILLSLPNDLLYSTLPPETPALDALRAVVDETAHTIMGIAGALHAKSLIGADYADFMALLKGAKSECAIGVGKADVSEGLDVCSLALERTLSSPFLGGLESIEKADAVMVITTGGKNMTFSDMKRSLELAAGIVPEDADFIAGAGITGADDQIVRMTAITVKFDPESRQGAEKAAKRRTHPHTVKLPEEQAQRNAASTQSLQQTELEFTSYSRGIFAKFPPVKYRDEDLDVPTFQRRNISIDKGS